MNKYQESLDYIVKSSCPQRTVCRKCHIKNSCNALVKEHIDNLQKLIDLSGRSLIKLKVRDLADGEEHIVGTNVHDVLRVNNGIVEYYNLQNGEGTGDGGCYEFVDKDLWRW